MLQLDDLVLAGGAQATVAEHLDDSVLAGGVLQLDDAVLAGGVILVGVAGASWLSRLAATR